MPADGGGGPSERRLTLNPFYFASTQAGREAGKYRLLIDSVVAADECGLDAVWLPERHFHAFGGIYPNPAVLCAALAMMTSRVRLRSGSVVLPLHNPIRVAEDWAVVDNLSEGRVDLSFARGWNPNDFVVAPGDYADRTQRLFDGIDIVRRLWRGEALHVPNGVGEPTEVRIFPMPRQAELEVWLTCSGGAQRFVEAGQLGFNVLTNLILQPLDELSAKIRLYREARETAGHAGPGKVTVMLHTLLGADEGRVREAVEAPFRAYLESSVDLWGGTDRRLSEMSEAERAEVLGYAFERYYRTCALFGTPQSCLPLVRRLGAADVDELACLIDFGAPDADVVHGVRHMRDLQDLANAAPPPVDDLSSDGKTELLRRLLRRRSEAEGRL